MKGDLHIHTNKSDGSMTAQAIIELASRVGLSHIAITDHDRLSFTPELFLQAQAANIVLINAVEISAFDYKRGRRVHILCYAPMRTDKLAPLCAEIQRKRNEVGIKMTELVAKYYPITLADVQRSVGADGCIFKQHIAQELLQISASTCLFGELYSELFDSKRGSCVLTFQQPNVYEVIDIVRSSGGACVMAHPFTYDSTKLLDELIAQQLLDGVEVWSSKADSAQQAYLSELADKAHIIKTGGSDFHGAFSFRISPLGSATTPEKSLTAMERFFSHA